MIMDLDTIIIRASIGFSILAIIIQAWLLYALPRRRRK